MIICSLDALKKLEIVEVIQQARYRRKKTGKLKIGMMKFLALTLYLFAIMTLTLISSSAIIGCFKKGDFRDLTELFETLSYHMHSCMRH